jgi:formylglycine-generating enzyme required for sulfatase activity
MRRILLCYFLLPLLISTAYAQSRVALVIGNSSYSKGFLPNPVNDADDIATVLKTLGFKVTLIKNSSRATMLRAVQQFKANLSARTEVAFFFYAGHGAQFEGDSYLLPLKSSIASTADLPIEALKARDILTQMRSSGSKVNVMVLDACRDLPYPALKRGGARGLARINNARSALIAYSTSLGNTAADGRARNSPYTAVLKNYLPKKNLPLTQLFNDVGFAVDRNTRGKQTPWVSSSPMPRVYLAGKGQASVETNTANNTVNTSPQKPMAVVNKPNTKPRQNDEPEMKYIRGGRFTMGSPLNEKGRDKNEKPHSVQVKNFWMSKTEVTFAQWDACVVAGGCKSNKRPRDEGWGRGNRPVINVSWHDANEYAQWLSQKTGKQYRLPTEAQWEVAARGGTKTAFSFGNSITTRQANFNGTLKKTVPVGSYPANQYGLQDMHGNVWEWVQDMYQADYKKTPKDGSAWESGKGTHRVFRGGSWFNAPRRLRSAIRYSHAPNDRYFYLGFRLARSLDK